MNALFAPASLPWLVWHDVRVRARGREGRWGRWIALAVLALLPLAGGLAAAWEARDAPMLPPEAFGRLSAALAAMGLVMLSSAYAHVLRLGRDRGELELLLSAPIPAARAVAARAAGVQAVVALPFLLLTTPFFLASAVLGHWRWLAGPLVVVAVALLATALALAIATGLDRLLGPARARLVAQLTGVALGAAMFALGQAPNFAPRWFNAQLAALEPPPAWPLDVPARAALGDPVPLMLVLALAVLASRGAARLTAARLEAAAPPGTIGGAVATGRRRAGARFGGSPFAVLFGKELRLLGRDPELIAQIGQQLVFMVPVLALIFTDGRITPARMAAAGVFLGGALASSLAWLVIAAEDAPDLIQSAPISGGTALRAKLAAALVPPMVLVVALAAAVATRSLAAAALMLPMALLAGLATAALQSWTRQPARRSAFRQRYRSSLMMAVGEFILLGSLAMATRLLLFGSGWALLALAIPAVLLLAVWMFRIRPEA